MADIKQNQLIGYWAKTRGITLKDIEKHPQIEDVILLLNYKDTFGYYFTKSEASTWGALWSRAYHKKRSIKPQYLEKLAQIGTRIKTQREKIHTLRHKLGTTQTQNSGCNMTANDPDTATTS